MFNQLELQWADKSGSWPDGAWLARVVLVWTPSLAARVVQLSGHLRSLEPG